LLDISRGCLTKVGLVDRDSVRLNLGRKDAAAAKLLEAQAEPADARKKLYETEPGIGALH
jgi:hypothetical protein